MMLTEQEIIELKQRIERLEKMLERFIKGKAGERAAMIQHLGVIEDTLGYQRSITPRSRRGE